MPSRKKSELRHVGSGSAETLVVNTYEYEVEPHKPHNSGGMDRKAISPPVYIGSLGCMWSGSYAFTQTQRTKGHFVALFEPFDRTSGPKEPLFHVKHAPKQPQK